MTLPKFLLFTFVCISYLITYHPSLVTVLATTFSSDNYVIEMGNLNLTSGKKTSASYTLTDTVGQNTPGLFTSNGYLVKSGFQYIYETFYTFSFTINDTDLSINLGSLSPGVGSTDSHTITVSSPAGHGYQILAAENSPLSLASGSTIPDTSCNGGAETCTIDSSALWTDTSAYGFGFQTLGLNTSLAVTNIGTSQFFTDTDHYRPFANLDTDSPQTIMEEDSPTRTRTARVTYKANISAEQPAGDYENSIVFIAVPKY